jgi:hypothetical protein
LTYIKKCGNVYNIRRLIKGDFIMNLKKITHPEVEDIDVEDDDDLGNDFERWLIKTGQKKVLAGE